MNYNNIGIIDIGSNSVRLVIFEIEPGGAYRIIYENKFSARLGKEVKADGTIPHKALEPAIQALLQFQAICEAYHTVHIRAGATAAIRNAANSKEIIGWLQEETGLTIEAISGEQEAYFGFLGVIHSMSIQDGIIVDIGGGSTEITLFRDRKLEHSISLPIGAVNGLAKYGTQEVWDDHQIEALRSEVIKALRGLNWTRKHPELPLIGLGGTIRSIAKMHQRQVHYSLPVTHHYEMKAEAVEQFAETLPFQTTAQRKKLPGLSKDRADLIVPGVLILQTVFKAVQADRYVVSGAGLRDGLFRDYIAPEQPIVEHVLEASIRNILRFEPPVPEQMRSKAYDDMIRIYQALNGTEPDKLDTAVMYTSAMLHESGTLINFYKSSQHSVYRILYSGIYGLSHRESVLSAIAADYHPKKRTPQMLEEHRDILEDSDTERAHRLGSLLRLTKAARSSMAVKDVSVQASDDSMDLQLHCATEPLVEQSTLEEAARDFEDAWHVKLALKVLEVSTY